MVRNKIELTFGNPKYGWLPVEFKFSEFKLNFDASDVPKNPTNLLCDCLIAVLKGRDAKMYWFLEPGYYLFEFIPNNKGIDLIISSSSDSIIKQKRVYKISGSIDSIILPLYQTLINFNKVELNELDWQKIDKIKLTELTELIK